MDRRTIYNNNIYSLGFDDNRVDLYSLDKSRYPDILGLERKMLNNAFKILIWVRVKDCDTLFEGKKGQNLILNVRPSEDVETLGAEEVERGVFRIVVSKKDIQMVWEERLPYQDFPFPKEVEKKVELAIDDLLK